MLTCVCLLGIRIRLFIVLISYPDHPHQQPPTSILPKIQLESIIEMIKFYIDIGTSKIPFNLLKSKPLNYNKHRLKTDIIFIKF